MQIKTRNFDAKCVDWKVYEEFLKNELSEQEYDVVLVYKSYIWDVTKYNFLLKEYGNRCIHYF
jgi:hypothetical protein